ncbi:hypothetical protein M413DRAFT_126216 [Hebeloma cylindrosporum]|uniref:Uncharacterized protein n=1 Tax=Hebeloma cylindrosporum TaxID=76867 RepID=A0A0C2X9K5_HEBCY|nr:hypothetical protein M413DRAFT_126216 [Hebeloma cylindrosporum h7]
MDLKSSDPDFPIFDFADETVTSGRPSDGCLQIRLTQTEVSHVESLSRATDAPVSLGWMTSNSRVPPQQVPRTAPEPDAADQEPSPANQAQQNKKLLGAAHRVHIYITI